MQGYYHHGSALLAVGRAWDARNSFAQALALSPKTQLFVEGLAQAEAAYTSAYQPRHLLVDCADDVGNDDGGDVHAHALRSSESYHDSVKSIFLKDGSVEVRHINAERGKVPRHPPHTHTHTLGLPFRLALSSFKCKLTLPLCLLPAVFVGRLRRDGLHAWPERLHRGAAPHASFTFSFRL